MRGTRSLENFNVQIRSFYWCYVRVEPQQALVSYGPKCVRVADRPRLNSRTVEAARIASQLRCSQRFFFKVFWDRAFPHTPNSN